MTYRIDYCNEYGDMIRREYVQAASEGAARTHAEAQKRTREKQVEIMAVK